MTSPALEPSYRPWRLITKLKLDRAPKERRLFGGQEGTFGACFVGAIESSSATPTRHHHVHAVSGLEKKR